MENEDPLIPIYNILYDKQGKYIFTGDDGGLIKVWSATTGLLLTNLKCHVSAINAFDISYCNNYLASCSQEGLVVIWDLAQMRFIKIIKENENDPTMVLSFYKSQKEEQYLVVTSEKGQIYIYHMKDILEKPEGVLGTQLNSNIF